METGIVTLKHLRFRIAFSKISISLLTTSAAHLKHSRVWRSADIEPEEQQLAFASLRAPLDGPREPVHNGAIALKNSPTRKVSFTKDAVW